MGSYIPYQIRLSPVRIQTDPVRFLADLIGFIFVVAVMGLADFWTWDVTQLKLT